ncbi:MAG: ABC transporter permease [Cryomorphaceae bacterium]|nr:ABC transporter permease [Cryomorphaceae bacterium]
MILFKLAWRNLWRSKRRTWITISSVLFAVLLALFLESMDRGSQEVMVQNVVRFSTGYAQLQDTLYFDESHIDNAMLCDDDCMEKLLEDFPNLAYTVPRLESVALAAGDEKTRVGFITGIHYESENRFNNIGERMREGHFFTGADDEVVIGTGLARSLDLKVGDSMVVFGQGFQGAMAAGKFVVAGLVQHPVPDLNERIVFMPLHQAQWLFDAFDRVNHLKLVPQRLRHHQRLVDAINAHPDYEAFKAFTWEELQPELVQTIEFDQAGTLVFLLILYVVIGFGIFGTVLTMTLEREKEFGVLISLGMQRRKLAQVIFTETLIMNFLGVLFGLLLSIPVLLYFYYNPIPLGEGMEDMMAEYGMEAVLRFSLDPQFFYQQAIIVFCISMVIVAYPVARVLRLDVLKAARK